MARHAEERLGRGRLSSIDLLPEEEKPEPPRRTHTPQQVLYDPTTFIGRQAELNG